MYYGTDEYYEKIRRLEEKGFFDNYNQNFLEKSFIDDQIEDDDEWEDEEYER